MPKYERRYSGPGKSGICICGCSWEDHHLGIVMSKEYLESTVEAYIPGECDRFGFNETGGMKYDETTKTWVNHCHGYVDAGC
jgi:hypothetical protein